MTTYTWHRAPVPADLKITQVHGLAFNADGQLFLRRDQGLYKTTGGTPEPGETLEQTLRREFLEEASITLENIHYLGYQLADEGNGTPPYAQARMIAKISEVLENRPDPDSGRVYERLFVDPAEAPALLAYGPLGDELIKDACALAKEYRIL